MKKLRVVTVIGTRPEIIRLSEIIRKFDIHFEHYLIHTSQNYDPKLNQIFFDDLGLRRPNLNLDIKAETLGEFLGALFVKMEEALTKIKPDAFIVLGDTNSALSSIIAKRFAIPIYHLEAGNRSFDNNVPEEINRKIVDHVADFNLVYTEHARRNLLDEGLPTRSICLTGSPLREVIMKQRERIESSKILEALNLQKHKFFLVSLHRQENIDFPGRLNQIMQALNRVAIDYDQRIIVSTHPRTRKILSTNQMKMDSRISFEDPFSFSDYNKMQKNARLVLSDSGTISEESAILGFKAVTIRDSIERPEALENGSIYLGSTNTEMILKIVAVALNTQLISDYPDAYKILNCSDRVLNFVISTFGQFSFWSALHSKTR